MITLKILKTCNISEHFIDIIYKNFQYISNESHLNHTKHEIGRILSSPNLYGLLAYHEGKIIGYMVGEFMNLNDGRNVYYISYFYVIKKYRGMKIGSRMMENIMIMVKKVGREYIVLTCDTRNKELVGFYKRFGFMKDILLQTMKSHDVFSVRLR